MEFEKEFTYKLKVQSYARNIETKKICQVSFVIEGKGIKNSDGDYMQGIARTFSVDIPEDMPGNDLKHEELSKDIMHHWIHSIIGNDVMESYIRSVYDSMYPKIEFFYPEFQYV